MDKSKPSIVITGVAGNLALRLLPMLKDFSVVGIDVHPPKTDQLLRFIRMDLGREESCRELFHVLKETKPVALIHLAFVLDQVRANVYDLDRMWQINIAGTARVMEAITECNREENGVQKFIYPSSVSVYGPSPTAVSEDSPLQAHTYVYGVHKKECDLVVQQRAPSLRGCSVYILRPHIFAGPSVDNYLVGMFRGTPNGKSRRAQKMRERGERLPCVLPYGDKYLHNQVQYVHIDDMARLIVHILHREPEAQRLTILNVAGRGEPLSIGRCAEISNSKVIRMPGRWACQLILKLAWKLGISALPPGIGPYIMGQTIMRTDRLQAFLGKDYEQVIRFTVAEAFAESLKTAAPVASVHSAGS
jgi:nucleoside-diphosphate-sugar epimerase